MLLGYLAAALASAAARRFAIKVLSEQKVPVILNSQILTSIESEQMLSKLLRIAAILVALVPLLAFSLGLSLDYGLTGCDVDEGKGASGCILLGKDISDAVEVLEFGGLIGLLLGFPLAFVLLVLLVVIGFFSRGKRAT